MAHSSENFNQSGRRFRRGDYKELTGHREKEASSQKDWLLACKEPSEGEGGREGGEGQRTRKHALTEESRPGGRAKAKVYTGLQVAVGQQPACILERPNSQR
eukprot:1142996-Pelagomonas_calceolata.AAC.3